MSGRAYIVPTALLDSLQSVEWHAHSIPDYPDHQLVVILWNNPNRERDFEAVPDVISLGDPWDTLPAEAVPYLTSLQNWNAPPTMGQTLMAPVVAQPPQSVSAELRKTGWSMGRMVR